MNIVKRVRQRVEQWLGGAGEPALYYVTDDANWAFYWVTHYVIEGLRRHGFAAHVTRDPWALRGQVVHFGNRYAYFDGPFRTFDRSNRVILTWFHGEPEHADAAMLRVLEQMREAAPYVDRVLVSCSIARATLIELGIPAGKLVQIPLGVDLARFTLPDTAQRARTRARLGLPPDAFVIGSFQKDGQGWGDGSEPKRVKGPDVFLQVIESVAAQAPNVWVLLTAPARDYVKTGLDRIGVPYVHHILDDYHAIVPYYHALDLYLITSRSEGGPKSLLESWATGVPVVSTRVGMPADLIQHGENGLLADIEDIATLSAHTLALLRDADLRARLAAQGQRDVPPYHWQIIADRYYTELYSPLLSRNPFHRFKRREQSG